MTGYAPINAGAGGPRGQHTLLKRLILPFLCVRRHVAVQDNMTFNLFRACRPHLLGLSTVTFVDIERSTA